MTPEEAEWVTAVLGGLMSHFEAITILSEVFFVPRPSIASGWEDSDVRAYLLAWPLTPEIIGILQDSHNAFYERRGRTPTTLTPPPLASAPTLWDHLLGEGST